MKKYLLLLLLASFSVEAQIVNIPDANFKAKLLEANPTSQIAQNALYQNIKIDVNNDGEIQESEAALVHRLNVSYSSITSLEGIRYFINLNDISCVENLITQLNFSGMLYLNSIDARDNLISEVDFSDCLDLTSIFLKNNNLVNFELSNLDNFQLLNLENNNLTSVTISNVNSQCDSTMTGDVVNFSGNPLEILNIVNSNLCSIYSENSPIQSFNSVNSEFPFVLFSNTQFDELNLSNISTLENIRINNNTSQFTMNLENCTSLAYVNSDSNLQSINLSGCFNLLEFEVDSQILNEIIGINDCESLIDFRCYRSNLNSIDLSGLSDLNSFIMTQGQLSELNLIGCSSLQYLDISSNNFTNFDISSFPNLTTFDCSSNDIDFLILKNGNENLDYYLWDNPLNYVCVDEWEVEFILFEYDGYIGHVNSYCSFTPGGEFYTIQGNSKFDIGSNGCDESDIDFPNMKFNITNGTISGSIISNTSGDYSIPVQEG